MEYRGAHVRERPKLPVTHVRDGFGVLDNAGVCRVKSGDVGPVLVEISADRAGRKASCDIRAAALEGMDHAAHVRSVETGDHSAVQRQERSAHGARCHRTVQVPVLVKTDAPCRIYEGKAEIFGNYFGSQIFAAARGVVPHRLSPERLLEDLEFLVEGKTDPKAVYDLAKTHFNLPQLSGKRLAGFRLLIQVEEKVCHFNIIAESFPRRRNDDKPSGRIAPNNVADLADLAGVRD